MVQIFSAPELPPDVPGMIVTDGESTAVLLNPAYMERGGGPRLRQVANALLAAADTDTRMAVAV